MDNATNDWDNEMNDLLAMVREQLEILHGEIFDRNVEHKVKDKCDTLIDMLKEIKIKREDMDAIIDVKKLLVSYWTFIPRGGVQKYLYNDLPMQGWWVATLAHWISPVSCVSVKNMENWRAPT
jgi:hypothetical protein